MVTFHTNHGDIVIKTFDDKAPETVKNFLDYCREGFYNNTIFHRVINGRACIRKQPKTRSKTKPTMA